MKSKMDDIRNVENKYGLMLFGMGLTHLMDVGHSNLTDENVEEGLKQIMTKGESDKTDGKIPVMTSEFQCEILRCSAELARFSIWTLFAYIKKYMEIGGI